MLEQGSIDTPRLLMVVYIYSVFILVCSPSACKGVQIQMLQYFSQKWEGLHFSAFHCNLIRHEFIQ